MRAKDMSRDDFGSLEVGLIMLLAAIKDIEAKERQGKCVINNSALISMGFSKLYPEWAREYCEFLPQSFFPLVFYLGFVLTWGKSLK
jgi:hypothetical protein